MYKIIVATIMAITTFSWFAKHPLTEPEEDLPTNVPFIIKSNLPGTCTVSTLPKTADSERNASIVACKVQLYTDY
ncbi:Uncharacterised protein [Yersinia pseudotuberculosis]|uniref:hypothetical protein n=1 Tax=Yersinia pseudotuberculosis TaxID=633 RepID=UPI0005E45248|nr:hypothetical protein [Yersinia pseudotuberculosis]MBO1555093.1 hypothetical protein [Yersinia pseudotuberculosis]CNK53907.1 Uncharacterised protein [Yersinia pseudotuberculosis]